MRPQSSPLTDAQELAGLFAGIESGSLAAVTSELDARFEAAVRKAGDEARARGISDEDIAAEIAAHRAGR